MKLSERYRRLSLWNKLTVWGSIASLAGLLLTLVLTIPFTGPTSNTNALQIVLECSLGELPTTTPPYTQLYAAFALKQDDVIAFNLLPMPKSGPEGGTMKWSGRTAGFHSLIGAACSLANYSGSVLFDVDLLVGTKFREAMITGAGQYAPGDAVVQHDWTLRVPKIDAEREKPFIFLVANQAEAYVSIEIHDAVTGLVAGRSDRQEIQLIRMAGNLSSSIELTPTTLSGME